jgi:hypothetical protein
MYSKNYVSYNLELSENKIRHKRGTFASTKINLYPSFT